MINRWVRVRTHYNFTYSLLQSGRVFRTFTLRFQTLLLLWLLCCGKRGLFLSEQCSKLRLHLLNVSAHFHDLLVTILELHVALQKLLAYLCSFPEGTLYDSIMLLALPLQLGFRFFEIGLQIRRVAKRRFVARPRLLRITAST